MVALYCTVRHPLHARENARTLVTMHHNSKAKKYRARGRAQTGDQSQPVWFTNEPDISTDCAVDWFNADGEIFGEFPTEMTLNTKLPDLLHILPIPSVRHAADPADRDDKSDQTGNQQPRAALDRHQDSDSENGAHSDPNCEGTKQFHGTDVTGRSLRFNTAFIRAVRRRPAVAKRLECVRLQRRFPNASCNSMARFMERGGDGFVPACNLGVAQGGAAPTAIELRSADFSRLQSAAFGPSPNRGKRTKVRAPILPQFA